MNFGFATIVLNGGDYLYYSLANTYALAKNYEGSKIVIVEGADSFSPLEVKTKEGSSIDKTREIIENFPDPLNLIQYKFMGNVKDKRELRQTTLDLLKDVDYIFIKDHDEFVKEQDMLAIEEEINKNPNLMLNLKHLLFRGDFYHRHTDEHGGHCLRVFKNLDKLNYLDWHTKPTLEGDEQLEEKLLWIKSNIPFYHYGYVGTRRNFYYKKIHTVNQLNWYFLNYKKDNNYQSSKLPKLKDYNNFPSPLDTLVKYPLNEHPEEVKHHPWFGLPVEKIWNYSTSSPSFLPKGWDQWLETRRKEERK